MAPPQGEKLQKVLARAGLGSRRSCERLIQQGRVRVDGTVARIGARIDVEAVNAPDVSVDGAVIGLQPGLVYYLLNKPPGVVTTAHDPHGRPTVVELVPDQPRVFPVGRLDLDTEGLILLTNDGHLANRLTHPSFGVPKEYLAHVRGTPKPAALRALRQGVVLDGRPTAPAKVSQVTPGLLRITIHEGRKRQVRRMCEAVGHPVTRLARVRIGPLTDTKLAPARWRHLTQSETRQLERSATRRARQP